VIDSDEGDGNPRETSPSGSRRAERIDRSVAHSRSWGWIPVVLVKARRPSTRVRTDTPDVSDSLIDRR